MTDKQAFEALKKLPFEFQIGGSLGLKMMGIIDREIYDIDIIVKSFDGIEGNVEDGSDEDVTVIRDGGVKIEVYEGDEDYLPLKNEYGDWKVSMPRYAIAKKREYVNNCVKELNKPLVFFGAETQRRMNKHLADINAYEAWLTFSN